MANLQDQPETDGREDNVTNTDLNKMIKWAKLVTYFLVIISLLAVLLGAIVMTCIRYNKWPIYTEVNFIPQNRGKFPAVTICPISNGYKENVLQVIGLLSFLTMLRPV